MQKQITTINNQPKHKVSHAPIDYFPGQKMEIPHHEHADKRQKQVRLLKTGLLYALAGLIVLVFVYYFLVRNNRPDMEADITNSTPQAAKVNISPKIVDERKTCEWKNTVSWKYTGVGIKTVDQLADRILEVSSDPTCANWKDSVKGYIRLINSNDIQRDSIKRFGNIIFKYPNGIALSDVTFTKK